MRQKNILPILFVTLLLDVIGFGMLIPVIPALFTDPTSTSFMLFGYSVQMQYFIAGLVTALFGIMQFLAAPLLGELSDTFGRKKLLTLGVGVLAVAQLLFATGIAIGSLVLILVSRAVAGIAGANFSIAQAAIADITAPENRARNFGLIGAAFGLGFIIGPLLGGFIVGVTGNPALPFLVAGILGIINLGFVSLVLPETHHQRVDKRHFSVFKSFHNIKQAFSDVDTRPLYLIGFLQMIGFAFFTSFISIFLVSRFAFTEVMTGTYFGIVGGWMIFTQVVLVRILNKKYSEQNILKVALPILALVILLYPFVENEIFLYSLIPMMAATVGLISTSLPSLISKGVSREHQGAALGINGSLQALSQGVAPILAGGIAGLFGVPAVFTVGGMLVVVAALVVWHKQLFRTRSIL